MAADRRADGRYAGRPFGNRLAAGIGNDGQRFAGSQGRDADTQHDSAGRSPRLRRWAAASPVRRGRPRRRRRGRRSR